MTTPGGNSKVTWGEDGEYEIEAEVSDYDPGRAWGRPENCYPPEGGEVEITSVKKHGVVVDTDEFWKGLSEAEQTRLDRALFNAVDRTPDFDDCGGDFED